MFQFKGTAAADASSNADERDWRVADHCNIQQLGRRPFTTMLQPTLHHRSMTEDTRRPSAVQSRSRSTSSVASQSFVGETRPARNLSIDDFISPPTLYGQPTSGGHAHARGGHSDSFGKTLMAKGSRLLRRQNNNHRADKHDLTPLSTLDWLEDTSGRDYLEEVSNESGSRYSRMNGELQCQVEIYLGAGADLTRCLPPVEYIRAVQLSALDTYYSTARSNHTAERSS